MRRGSVSTWETFGRRSSANMAQYIGGPVQFMTSDDIKYRPTDGWFVSYKKATSIVIFIIFVLIVVGLIGWYSHATPTKRVHDALSLINGESTKEMAKPSHISPHIRPLKYWLYFKPTIMDYNNNNNNNNNNNSNSDNNTTTLTGRVVIEFQIDSSNLLQKLSLNAVNITMKRYELSLSIDEDSELSKKRSKRENETDVIVENIENENYTTSYDKNSTIASDESNRVIVNLGNDPNIPLENGTHGGEEETGLVPGNGTLPFDIKVSKIKDDWFSMNGIGKGDEIVQIREYEINQVNGLHVIHPTKKLKRGVYFLMIDFEANPTNDVLYVVDSSFNEERKRMMGTLLKTAGASRLFPLFDEIYLRAIFSLSVERPKEMRVLSNMPLRSTKDASDNSLIDTFNDTPLISPHNLAFVVGNLEAVDHRTLINPDMSVTFWAEYNTTSQGFYLLDKVEPTIVGLTDVLSIPYWLPKLDMVCLPWKIVRSSGNPGLITMRKSLFYADDRSPLVTRTEALKTLIGLLGEQWLGGRVNVKSWTNAWILEGSLIYFQHLLIEKIDPSLGFAHHSFVTDVETKAMESDGYDSSRSLRVKINPLRMKLLSMARNMRGACLIRMLHATISNDTAFRIAYKKLLTSQNDGSVDAMEFWNFMNDEAKEFPDNLSPKVMIDAWISQTGYPLVTVLRNYEDGSAIVRQKKFSYDVPTAERDDLWHIPLTYVGIDDDWSSPRKEWLNKEREQIFRNVSAIDNNNNETDWILFNVNKTGYYRVNYDEKNWRLLAMALNENHEAFPVETRASLVDDVFALAAVGSSKYETAFGFIKYMQIKERHYAPWSAFAHHVFKLNNVLYETSAFLDFQEFLQKLITPLYNEVGEKLGEGSQLTLIAVKLACLSEHSKCLNWAKQSFVQLKRNPSFKHTIPMYIRRTLYCMIARHGGRDEWDYIYQKTRNSMKTEEKNNLLSSFGCFQIPGVLQSIIDEIIQDDKYNDDEICVILKSFSTNPIASRMAYKYIMRNWKNILRRFHDSYSVIRSFILAMMNGVTNEQDLMDLHTFWENNYESIKTVKYAAALVEAKANFAISLITNYSQEIKEWLKDNNDSGA